MIKMKKEKAEVSTCIQSTCLPSPCRLGLECLWISSWLSISGRQDPPRLRESDGSGGYTYVLISVSVGEEL